MSYILNVALGATLNTLKVSGYRLLQRSALLSRTLNKVSSGGAGFSILRSAKPIKNIRYNCTRAYDIETNVTKDVVLFKYDNPKFYNILNIFAVCQFIFWNYLSHFAYTTLKDAPVEQNPEIELAWYQRINLGENKYRNGITAFCFLIGYGVMAAAWMFTLRSVRFLILRRGGKEISFVTYGPFNKNRIMTVPLKNVSAQESRVASKVQLPLKVKNRSLYYILDMRGEFRNPKLFDYTAGLKRRLVE